MNPSYTVLRIVHSNLPRQESTLGQEAWAEENPHIIYSMPSPTAISRLEVDSIVISEVAFGAPPYMHILMRWCCRSPHTP